MIRCRGIEFPAEVVCEKITGHQHEGRVRQCLCHALQGRAEQHPIAVPPVSAEAAVTGAIEHCAPSFWLRSGQLVDQPWIRHRVEMQVGHHEDLPGNGLRRSGLLAACRSAQAERKGRQRRVPEASQYMSRENQSGSQEKTSPERSSGMNEDCSAGNACSAMASGVQPSERCRLRIGRGELNR